MVAEHRECLVLFDLMTLHQDPLGALGGRAPLERAFQVPKIRKAAQDYLDRVLPLLGLAVGDVGEDTALRGFEDEFMIGCVKESHDRAGRLVDDLLDQLQRMLRALAEADERNVWVLTRGHCPDLAHLDLRDEHLVPKPSDDGRDSGKTILALVGDEHPKPFHVHVRAPNGPQTRGN